jgi:hypothetical protein
MCICNCWGEFQHCCVEMMKQQKMGKDVEVGDRGDHEEVKVGQEMATAGSLHEEGAV